MEVMTYNDLTPNMRKTVAQMAGGLNFVDVRSGAALHRRGLARYEPHHAEGGHYFATYHLTEAGQELWAKEKARREVRQWQIEHKHWLTPEACANMESFARWKDRQ